MSNVVSDRVWKNSKTKGPLRLLLIALADHANSSGVCFPGIELLASKTGKSVRQTQRDLPKIIETGEVYIEFGHGRGNTHKYFVVTGLLQEEITLALAAYFEMSRADADLTAAHLLEQQQVYAEKVTSETRKGDTMTPFTDAEKVTSEDIKGDIQGLKGDILDIKGDVAMSPEPCNHINPIEPLLPAGKKISQKSREEKRAKATTEKQASCAMFETLANLCQYDIGLITDNQRGALNQAGKKMRSNGYTPDDLKSFSEWWYANDWRGRQNQPPTLTQIRDTWGQFRNGRKQSNGYDKQHNGSIKGTGENLNQQPTFNPYTGEIVMPDLPGDGDDRV